MEERYDFASDNTAGIAPEAFEALRQANQGYAPGYGEDAWTLEACDLLREIFETDCDVFFTFNGTAANSLALASMCQSYHSIICHQYAHVETDECGGPEFFSNGTKVLVVEGPRGKVTPSAVESAVNRRTDVHYPKPRVVSVTQSTELGTTYKGDELDALSEVARRHALRVHMDGARFANAAASLGLPPAELTWKRGIDVLCLGGTKLGAPVGDAVIFFDHDLASDFEYRCKQAGQLASKMRFLAASWVGMLKGGAWLKHARHANACALRLAGLLRSIPGVEVLHAVEANAVFAKLPEQVAAHLESRGWHMYSFIGEGGARLMSSWQTTDADIDALVADVRAAISTKKGR